jgi:hypothetical protein
MPARAQFRTKFAICPMRRTPSSGVMVRIF